MRPSDEGRSRSASSAAASAVSRPRCRCCRPGSTSTSTSAPRPAQRGRRRHPGQPERVARPARARPRPTSWRGWACARSRCTSAAGTTGGRCCARRSATPWSRPSASRTTRPTAPICWRTLVGALPPERLHVGHRFERPRRPRRPRRGGVRERHARSSVDVLVGADGIHSDVRGALFGPEEPRVHRLRRLPRPRPGRAPAPPRARGDRADLDGARRALRPLLRAAAAARQLRRDLRAGHAGRASRGPTAARSADALAAFEGWHPQVRAILGAVDETFIWALFDRPPLPRWSQGRVTLLGDACHPMLPFMAQGAAQALEDGATLTACLRARRPTSRAALRALRAAAAAARVADPGDVDARTRRRFHLPDGPDAAGARRAHGGRLDRLRAQGGRVDLRARRRRRAGPA